jgi:hypothetical protein
MHQSSGLRIDPTVLPSHGVEIEVAIPYTDFALAGAVLERAASLTAGLEPTIRLIAVHTIPYQLPLNCQTSVHARLVEQLVDLASNCPHSVDAQVVLARSQDEGFRHLLKRDSIVLIGTRRHFWRTREEQLARSLAAEGYQVALLHID